MGFWGLGFMGFKGLVNLQEKVLIWIRSWTFPCKPLATHAATLTSGSHRLHAERSVVAGHRYCMVREKHRLRCLIAHAATVLSEPLTLTAREPNKPRGGIALNIEVLQANRSAYSPQSSCTIVYSPLSSIINTKASTKLRHSI